MKCTKCKGDGCIWEESDSGIGYFPKLCPVCHGTGEVIVRNGEWFSMLDNVKKADFLANICKQAVSSYMNGNKEMLSEVFWKDWLTEEKKEDKESDRINQNKSRKEIC